jgi:hypothetical protein
MPGRKHSGWWRQILRDIWLKGLAIDKVEDVLYGKKGVAMVTQEGETGIGEEICGLGDSV